MDINRKFDNILDETKETSEKISKKTKEFHEEYVSKFVPNCGKYGNVAKFVAEMISGVSEYNAVREGDWKAFAIAAGIDIVAIGVGAFTAGAGYGLVRGGNATAKASVKAATKEIAKIGSKKVINEVTEVGVKKVANEIIEGGVKKVTKEVVEEGMQKTSKEIVEEGTKKITKDVTEVGAKRIVKYIECRNSSLLNDVHPETGVRFIKKIVDDGTGNLVEGVFPKFHSSFDAKLSEELFKESNAIQFKEANKQLLNSINKSQLVREKFSSIQIEQITEGVKSGIAPDGFVWHHSEELGILQLVDENIHRITGHTGGRVIWGGGY